MKQLNHSPEAAAAVLGLSLKTAYGRIAWLRRQGTRRTPPFVPRRAVFSDSVRMAVWNPVPAPV